MSDQWTPGASLGDVVTTLKLANQNMSLLIQTIQAIFPRVTGTFTLDASVTTVVTETGIQADSIILLVAMNAAAGTLVGSTKSPYISARTVGTSFSVSTASGVAAAGTEQFSYVVVNPV